jgi:hypothetical protein
VDAPDAHPAQREILHRSHSAPHIGRTYVRNGVSGRFVAGEFVPHSVLARGGSVLNHAFSASNVRTNKQNAVRTFIADIAKKQLTTLLVSIPVSMVTTALMAVIWHYVSKGLPPAESYNFNTITQIFNNGTEEISDSLRRINVMMEQQAKKIQRLEAVRRENLSANPPRKLSPAMQQLLLDHVSFLEDLNSLYEKTVKRESIGNTDTYGKEEAEREDPDYQAEPLKLKSRVETLTPKQKKLLMKNLAEVNRQNNLRK